MKLCSFPYFLKFKNLFGIAKLTRTGTDSIIVTLTQNGLTGYGEAVLPPYVKEKPTQVLGQLEQTFIPDFQQFDLAEIDNLLSSLPFSLAKNPAYYAAIDIALHDLLGKLTKKSIRDLYQITAVAQPLSSYTIGFSTEAELAEKLKAAQNFSLIKLKLGGPNDMATINWVSEHCSLPIAVDLNQAWEKPNRTLIKLLEQKECVYLEEPFRRELVSIKTTIPILADEHFQQLCDLETLPPFFQGINIKLMKCGGLRQAYQIIQQAKASKLKVVLGCMSDSSCGVAAMSHFSSLVNWIDLDGPALIANDPFTDLKYEVGQIKLGNLYGSGVDLKHVYKVE